MAVTGAQIRLEIGRSLVGDDGKPLLHEIVNSGVVATSVTDAVNLAGTGKYTSQAFNGWAVRCNSGTAIGVKSYALALTATTGLLTVNPNLQTTPANLDTFELWRTIDPDDVDRAIDRALSQDCTRWRMTPVTILIDGDFETAGVTNWTGSNATPTKTTPSGGTRFADQALTVTNSGANGYAGQTISVQGDQQIYVWGLVQASVGTAAFTVQDLTNAAAISVDGVTNATWAKGDIGVVHGSFTVPSTCRSLSVRFGASGASDVSVWQSFSIAPLARNMPLTARLAAPDFTGLFYHMEGTVWPNVAAIPLEVQPSVKDAYGVGLSATFNQAPTTPIFYGEYANYAALRTVYTTTAARGAADAATTNCPFEYVKAAAIMQLFGNEAKPLVSRGRIEYYKRWEDEFRSAHRMFGAKKTVRFVDELVGIPGA